MSEKTEAKARTYLSDGKVKVVLHDDLKAVFSVQGKDKYTVKYIAGAWGCNCPAYVECAHLIACKLISPLVEKKFDTVPVFGNHSIMEDLLSGDDLD